MKLGAVACTVALLSTLRPVAAVAVSSKTESTVAVSSKTESTVAVSSKTESDIVRRATALAQTLEDLKLNATALADLSPIEKVLDMLNDLRMKVVNEEKEAYILYSQYTALCDKKYQATSFLIVEEEQQLDEFRAALKNELAWLAESVAKISDLVTSIAVKTREWKAAQTQYDVDKDLYATEIKELSQMILMLRKAIEVLESDKGAAMLQLNSTNTLAQTLDTMVKASAISYADSERITALVQRTQDDNDDDSEDSLGAPTAVYKKQSGSVVETLSMTLDKAKDQLDRAEKAEAKTHIDFQLLEKALTNKLDRDKELLAEIRGESPDHEGLKANDEGEIVQVKDMLTVNMKVRNMSVDECKKAAREFTAESKLREEEVIVQTRAINAIRDATGAKTTHQFNFTKRDGETITFLQEKDKQQTTEKHKSYSRTFEMDTYFKAVHLVKDLADEDKSNDLKLLTMRMTNAVRSRSKDPFKKVKDLINQMLVKLETEAANEADDHAFCSANMAKAEKAIADAQSEVFKAQARFDAAEAAWMKCKREIQEILKSGTLTDNVFAKETEIRGKEEKLLDRIRKENEVAMTGVDQAIKILNDYYGNDASTTSTDVAHTIVDLLKLIREDLEKSLLAAEADEEVAKADYEKSTAERDLEKKAYEKDLKHKEDEEPKLRKVVADLQVELKAAQDRLASAHEFYDEIRERCLTSVAQFEERVAKMNKELAGLREALAILKDDDAALLQDASRRSLRGLAQP